MKLICLFVCFLLIFNTDLIDGLLDDQSNLSRYYKRAEEAFKNGDYRQTVDYYMLSLQILENLYPGEDHLNLAATLTNIGFAYDHLGELDQALLFKERGLQMRKRIYRNEDNAATVTSI